MISKYQRIADRLRAQLTDETRIRTTKLPTEKELCALYGVSRQTVRQALHVLEAEGLIERRPFRAPHHTISPQALSGGGAIPKPGEVPMPPDFTRMSLTIRSPSCSLQTTTIPMPDCGAICRIRS